MLNLKMILMQLGNKLVMEHGYDPATIPVQAKIPNTIAIKDFTEFVNNSPESRVVLREMGLEWPIAAVPKKVMKETLCKHCDHFVDDNYGCEDDNSLAKHIHMEDGEQEFDHDAEPGQVSDEWDKIRPDLFKEYPDGEIGPNSQFHSRRGKIDGLTYSQDTSFYAQRKGVAEKLFADYDFEPNVVAETNNWDNAGDCFTCVYFLENGPASKRCVFKVVFAPNSTQVIEMS